MWSSPARPADWAKPRRGIWRRGAKLILGARRIDRLEALSRDLSLPKDAVVETDVRDAHDVKRLVDQAVSLHGRIDVLLNNAGVMPLSLLEALKLEEWDRMVDVNIKGVLYGIAAALAAHDRTEKRPHHQRVVGGGPQDGAGLVGLFRHQACGAGAVGGAAPGGQAAQYPHHHHLAGRGGDRIAATASPIQAAPNMCAVSMPRWAFRRIPSPASWLSP